MIPLPHRAQNIHIRKTYPHMKWDAKSIVPDLPTRARLLISLSFSLRHFLNTRNDNPERLGGDFHILGSHR